MPLAAILGMCLLLSWPSANIPSSVPTMAIWQSTQSQDSQPSNSSQQGPASQPPTDQQKASDQPATPPPPPAATTQPCPENSQPGSTVKSDCKPAQSTGTKTKKRHHKAVAHAMPAGSGPTKTVVRNGGTSDPTVNLSPGVSSQQASRQMESTNQLLATSDTNLKKVSGRQLNPNQQDTVKQIRSYMEQSKTAAKGGDAQRAYNLAVKANLLSAELVGH
jgi:hypothetical protein